MIDDRKYPIVMFGNRVGREELTRIILTG